MLEREKFLHMETPFCLDSKKHSIDKLVYSLQKNAYAVIENAVPQGIVSELLTVTASPVANVNCNDLSSVIHGKTQFFTNIIAHSKAAHDIILSPLVVDLCASFLGDNCQLVNNRIQTTRANIAMPWHTDNNLLSGGKLVGRHGMPGLQFVLYLTDVSSSPFQLIKNSHEWSLSYEKQYILDSDILSSNFDIVEIIPKPGTLLILNTHLFHRAAPIRDSSYMRSILLFQVDQLSADYPYHGERLFINPAFLSEFNTKISTLLGFGRRRDYSPFPESSLATLDLKQAYLLLLKLLRTLPGLALIKLIKRFLPADALAKIKITTVFANSRALGKQSTSLPNPYLED